MKDALMTGASAETSSLSHTFPTLMQASPKMSKEIDKPVYIGKFKILADGQKLHGDRDNIARRYGRRNNRVRPAREMKARFYTVTVKLDLPSESPSSPLRLGFGE